MSDHILKEDYTVMVVIYNEVVFYPPTVNAIYLLAAKFKHVLVVEVINEGHIDEVYPENVTTYSIYRRSHSYYSRLETFVDFTKEYTKLRKREKPNLILLYDSVAAMVCWFSQWTLKRSEVYWYHNHDVLEKKIVRPFSLQYFAYYLERKVLPYLDIFTIPSVERMAFYDLKGLQCIQQVLPNYPSVRFFSKIPLPEEAVGEIVLIYQGNISEGHGFEEIMELLPHRINNKLLKLRLIGFSNHAYDAKLKDIIERRNLQNEVAILDKVTYQKLPFITRECHIGLAVYTKKDVMNTTLGTASNKIYEYTAIGLPFLYFENPHFTEYLGKMEWAFPTDLTANSILKAVQQIDNDFERLSELARNEFLSHRNYEKVFTPLMDTALNLIRTKANRN